jgi:phosphoglucosamine mutase
MSIKTKYFGTDGFRGEANIELTAEHAFKIGRFLGWYYNQISQSKPRIIIGKDTRKSSYMLEYAVAAGITSSGADAYMLHVTTTPSVSYIVKQDIFDCGIMITASHNPFTDNGIKVINRRGEKLEEEVIVLIESYLDGDLVQLGITSTDIPLAFGKDIGTIVDYTSGRNRYIDYLISLASHSYRDIKIGIDCANGASWMIAKTVFDALGAQTHLIGVNPNGININDNCGSTHTETLRAIIKENKLDLGFAFDGDADRCIAIDENGNVVDGDKILYILAKRLKRQGILGSNAIVATVMSNLGLIKGLSKESIKCELTAVGDKYVYAAMLENDFQLGGEQSGHIIMRQYSTTGDALITAILLTEEMLDRKCSFSKLCEHLILYPQMTKNYKVFDKSAVVNDETIMKQLAKINDNLSKKGRILLRASGTENLIRIMAESQTQEECESLIKQIEKLLKERDYL